MAQGGEILLVYPKDKSQAHEDEREESQYVVKRIHPAAINFSDYIVLGRCANRLIPSTPMDKFCRF